MSGRSFRSVFMVASCAGAALGCYLVSLRVASERAALEDVETKIVLAQRDLRLLQTEIGTRGRLAQLERWNVKVLALSAPSADQFLNGGFELAKMVAPERKIDLEAPVVLASARIEPKSQIDNSERIDTDQGASAQQLMHVASFKSETSTVRSTANPAKPSPVGPTASEDSEKPKPVARRPVAVETDPVKTASAKAPSVKAKSAIDQRKPAPDPLAPLAASAKPKKLASATSKDVAKKQ